MSIRLQKNFYKKNNLDFSFQNTETRSKNFEFFEKRNMLQRGGVLTHLKPDAHHFIQYLRCPTRAQHFCCLRPQIFRKKICPLVPLAQKNK
jgi:hypothetical protein